MAKINKVNTLKFPTKKGWYWVLIDGYNNPTPCWFGYDVTDDEEDKCFLPGGMGDSSSCGLYADDIKRIGPEIIQPEF
jgi:hypothetical protein